VTISVDKGFRRLPTCSRLLFGQDSARQACNEQQGSPDHPHPHAAHLYHPQLPHLLHLPQARSPRPVPSLTDHSHESSHAMGLSMPHRPHIPHLTTSQHAHMPHLHYHYHHLLRHGPPKESRQSVKLSSSLSELTFLSAIKTHKVLVPGMAPCQVTSLVETKAERLIAADDDEKKILRHHSTSLTRTYPHGSRYNSSNYNPFPLLARGVQLVALNYQTTSSVHFQCYRAFFRRNGGCGYVLKSSSLRDTQLLADTSSVPSPLSAPPMLRVYRLTLLCGKLLPKPAESRSVDELWLQPHCPLVRPVKTVEGAVISPFVTVELVGGGTFACASRDAESCVNGGKWESASVSSNGFDPQWVGQSVELVASHPELTVLRIVLLSEQHHARVSLHGAKHQPQILGYEALPLDAVRCGIRSVQLRDRHAGRFLFTTLLVKLEQLPDRPTPADAHRHRRESNGDHQRRHRRSSVGDHHGETAGFRRKSTSADSDRGETAGFRRWSTSADSDRQHSGDNLRRSSVGWRNSRHV